MRGKPWTGGCGSSEAQARLSTSCKGVPGSLARGGHGHGCGFRSSESTTRSQGHGRHSELEGRYLHAPLWPLIATPRRYIYNQRQCGRCKGPVRTWDMAARTVYCCETCQPLNAVKGAAGAGGSEAAVALSPARAAALAAARPARVFVSHCAPDDPEDGDLAPDKVRAAVWRSGTASSGLSELACSAGLLGCTIARHGTLDMASLG